MPATKKLPTAPATKKVAKKKTTLPFTKVKKELTMFRPMVRSRHPSHSPLRTLLSRLPFRSVVRLGSTWVGDTLKRIECNVAQAIRTSASKRLMKIAFNRAGVRTADWWAHNPTTGNIAKVSSVQGNGQIIWQAEALPFPIVAKHIHGSRGTGNYLLRTAQEFEQWRQGKTITNYIFEKFYDYSREYRLHVSKNGCFYTCRKMLKEVTPEGERWYRNDSNSAWMLETNPLFDKPVNWNAIVAESVKALKAVGLDIGAIDVKVQSARNSKGQTRQAPEFIILETNSAPSFGEVTLQKYLTEIPRLLRDKYVNQK